MQPSKTLLFSAFSMLCFGCQIDSKEAERGANLDLWQAQKLAADGKFERSEAAYASSISKAEHSDNALQLPTILQQNADLYLTEKKYPEAERLLRRSIAEFQAASSHAGTGVAADRLALNEGLVRSFAALAVALAAQGKNAEAEQTFKDTLALNVKQGGPVELSISLRSNYIALLRRLNKPDEAAKLQDEADISLITQGQISKGIKREAELLIDGKSEPMCVSRLRKLELAANKFSDTNLTMQSQYYLALAQLRYRKPDEALATFDRFLVRLKTAASTDGLYPSAAENLAAGLSGSACCLELLGRSAEAQPIFQRAAQAQFPAMTTTAVHIIKIVNGLGNFDMVQKLIDVLAALVVDNQGKSAVSVGAIVYTINDIAVHAVAAKQFDRSLALHTRSVAFLSRIKTGRGYYANALEQLGQDNLQAKQFAAAESLFRQSLSMMIALHGANSEEVASVSAGLAQACNGQSKFSEGQVLNEKALSIYTKLKGPADMSVRVVKEKMAEAYEAQKLFAKAIAIREQQAELILKTEDHSSMGAPAEWNAIGADLRGLNKFPEAKVYYLKSVAHIEKSSRPRCPEMASTLVQFGDCCLLQKQYTQARELYQRALSIYRTYLKDDSKEIAGVLHLISSCN